MIDDEFDSHRHYEPTDCNREVMTGKVVHGQRNVYDLVPGLHQDTMSTYESIRRGVDKVLV